MSARLRPSPFGLDECCVCDAPATLAAATEDGEVLPYCAEHGAEVERQFGDDVRRARRHAGPARGVGMSDVRRNRTLAGDLELLVDVAGAGGRIELSLDDDGGYCALIMTAGARGRAYSGHGRSLRFAVRQLRDELERLAAGRGQA
jgi:hypothetical protein